MPHPFRTELTLENRLYFNHGGQGLLPESAIEAITTAYREIQHRGPFSMEAEQWIAGHMTHTRKQLADALGCSPNTITFTESTSHSMNIPLWGLDWQAGDGLMVSDCEHPGAFLPAHAVAQRYGLEIQKFDLLGAQHPVLAVEQALNSNTKLILLSHVLWNTGQVLPIKEITEVCRKQGVLVLWDGAQSSGVIPAQFEEWGVDFYGSTCHKWWMGPAGIGYLYIRPETLEQIRPTYVGWRSASAYVEPIPWYQNGQRFEVATFPSELFFGLAQSLKLHQSFGSGEERYARILELAQQLWVGLQEIPGLETINVEAPTSGLVCWRAHALTSPKELTCVVQALEAQKVYVRTIPKPLCFRASIHYFNEPWEIEKLLEILKAIGSDYSTTMTHSCN
jgi:L-cysteine/cystine lyase